MVSLLMPLFDFIHEQAWIEKERDNLHHQWMRVWGDTSHLCPGRVSPGEWYLGMTGICLPLLNKPWGGREAEWELMPCKDWSPRIERMFWVAPSWVVWNRLLWWPCRFNKLIPWMDGEFIVLPSLPFCLAKSFIKCNLRLWAFDGKLSRGHEFAWIFVTSRRPWSSLSPHPLHS